MTLRSHKCDAAVVRRTDNHHGYPFRAVCIGCGWQSQSYAAAHAAQIFADEHNKGE